MRKLAAIITTLVVVMSLGFYTQTVVASPLDDLKNKQNKVKDERKEVKKNLSKANKKIADLLFDLKELNEEIIAVDKALKHNQKMLKETERNIKSSEKEINELEKEIERIEADIEFRNDILKQRLTSLHKSGGKTQYLEVIFGASSFMDFVSRVSAVSQIANKDIDLIEKQEEDKQLVVEKHHEVEERLSEQKGLKEELDEIDHIITAQQKENKKKKKSLQKKEKELKTLKAELEEKDSDLASLEAQIRKDITNAKTQRNTTQVANNQTSDNLVQLSSNATGSISTILNAGRPHLGLPYYYGGKSPFTGFDCSGFVAWAYAQAGFNIPSSTAALSGQGQRVSVNDMKPGDLVFFDTIGGRSNSHVGIYLGNGQFIGSQTSKGISIERLNGTYWKDKFKGHVRRIIQ